jgi:hypothetical protein
VLHWWLSFWKVLPSPQRNSGALSEWTSGSWSPPRPRLFFIDCSVWPGGQLQEELVVPNLVDLRIMEDTVSLGTINAPDIFFVYFPRSVRQHNPFSEFYGQFLWPHSLVFALTCTVNFESHSKGSEY